jgi:hypothetical protein
MELSYRIVLALHVVAGAVGLFTMLPPLLARKGARTHRRVGHAFMSAMGVVVLTGFYLVAQWLLAPELFRKGASLESARVDAVFLASIAALTGEAVVQALSAIKRKHHPAPRHGALELSALTLLVVSAMFALAVGVAHGHVLSIVFAVGSLALALRDSRFMFRPLASRHAYLYQHIQSVGTACISAVTAFLVLGGRRIIGTDALGEHSWLLWVAPGAIAGPLFQLWIARTRRKLEGRPAARERPALDLTA